MPIALNIFPEKISVTLKILFLLFFYHFTVLVLHQCLSLLDYLKKKTPALCRPHKHPTSLFYSDISLSWQTFS